MRMTRWMIAALVVLGSTGAGRVAAMGYCPSSDPMTLRDDVAAAKVVMYGTVANPRVEKTDDNEEKGGLSDFHIKRVLKTAPLVGGLKVLQIPRYIPVGPKKDEFLIFF